MEKMVVVNGLYSLDEIDVEEVNEYLETGWSVKSVTTAVSEEHLTAIFVLENKTCSGGKTDTDEVDDPDKFDEEPKWKRPGRW